jgi:hypothetical protein
MRSFRSALPLLLVLLASSHARADFLPDRLNFQGKLVDPATNNPKTGSVSLTFKLYNVPTGGSALYTETQINVPLTNGVFAVQIGTTAAVSRELFLSASSYLGVTVVGDAGGEMVPRQQLVMNAYAFTAHQLADPSEVRLIAGTTFSTFTSAGNLIVPAGVSGSSGTFSNGVTAASGTFSATGSAQYSLNTSSGINMSAGTLDVTGSAGINAGDTGIILSTIDFTGSATDPAGNAGYMYYNTSTGAIKVFDGSGQWAYVFGQSLGRQFLTTTDNTAAVAVNKPANASVLVVPIYLPGPMMVNHMIVDVTTALGAAGDIGLYDYTGALVLNGGASSLTTTAAVKNIAPAQTGNARFLPPGQYYAAVTFNSTTGRLAGNTIVSGTINRVGSVNGGGTTLPGTITPSAVTAGTIEFFFEINP